MATSFNRRRRVAPGFTIPEKDYRRGSKVTGPGTETSDSVPAALSKNEFVIKASSAKKIGYDALHHMNRTGEIPMRMKKAAPKRIPMGAGRLKLRFGGLGRQRDDEVPEIPVAEEPPVQSKPIGPSPGGRTTEDMDTAATADKKRGVIPGMMESLKIRFGPRSMRYAGGGKAGLRKGYASGGKAHPGFKAVAAKIGKQPGIRNPGAVLAAATRRASPAAKRANPNLNRVK